MATNYVRIKKGANFENLASSVSAKGDVAYNSATDKLELYNGAVDPLVNEAKAATLTNKTMSGSSNTFSSIAYSSLVLTGTIVNADINSSAAIAYSKLALSNSIVNADIATGAAIAYSKLSLTGSIVNADVSNTAAVAYSKLALTNSIVNADIASAAAIAYSKLALTGSILNADITSAGIDATHGGTGNTTYTKGDILVASGSSTLTKLNVGTDGQIPVADSTQTTGVKWATIQQGAKNYITYNNFENQATTGWATGVTGTLTNNIPTGTPTFGSSPATVSLSINTSSPLAGTASLSLGASGARVQGDMYHTQVYTIDAEDQAKVLAFKFYYTPSVAVARMTFSGVASTSTFGIAVWDVTNSAWIATTGTFNLVQNSGAGICQGTFQTNSNTSQLRFCIYNANTTTGACTLEIDDVYVGPQALAFGPPVSDWTAFTPTGSFTTNTTYTGQYRRVGDTVEVHAFLAFSGTPNNPSGLLINMPPGLVIDSSKIAGASSTLNGLMSSGRVTGTGVPINVLYSSTTAVDIRFMSTPSGTNPQTITNATGFSSTAPITFTNGSTIDLVFSVPVVGWSSNTVMSADSNTRVTAARAFGPGSGTLNSTFNLVTFTGVTGDTNAGFSGNNTYTVPVTGYYNISAQLAITANLSASNAVGVQIVNSTTSSIYATNFFRAAATVNSTFYPSASVNGVFITAGNTIVVKSYSDNAGSYASGGDTTYFTIAQVTGPAVVAATESVNARYHGATASLSGSSSAVTYSTKDFDSHNAYSGSTYTIPVSGKYQINAGLIVGGTWALNGTYQLYIFKNGSNVTEFLEYSGGAETNISGVLSDIVSCLAGDTIQIFCAASSTVPVINNSVTSRNWLSISRVGN